MRVAFCGEPGSGKTALSELVGTRLSFAQAVKLELAEVLVTVIGLDVRDIIDAMNDPMYKDRYRHLLQVWGSYRRAQDPDYWVEKLRRRLNENMDGPDRAVDDCRYPNEYEMLQTFGFKFVRLQSGETTRHLMGEEAAHESEQYWPEFAFDLELPYLPLNYLEGVVRGHFE